MVRSRRVGKNERYAKIVWEVFASSEAEKENSLTWGHLDSFERYGACFKVIRNRGWMEEEEFVRVYLLNNKIFEKYENISSVIIREGVEGAFRVLSEKDAKKVKLNILKSKLS